MVQRWSRLAHGLGPLLGASLGLLAAPSRALAFSGIAQAGQGGQLRVLGGRCTHDCATWLGGALPTATLGTENVAALLALLPCGSARGLASLLRARALLAGAPFLAVRLRLERGRARVSLSAVLPDTAPSAWTAGGRAWGLADMLRGHIQGGCPCAAASVVRVRLLPREPSALHSVAAWPPPAVVGAGSDAVLHFDLLGGSSAGAACPALPTLRWRAPAASPGPERAPTHAARPCVQAHAVAHGLSASVRWQLSPPERVSGCAGQASAACEPCVSVLEQALPLWLQLWAHTLALPVAPGSQGASQLRLRPPELRRAMGWLQLQCALGTSQAAAAGAGGLQVQVQGRLPFLAVAEHPPGVHRGMLLPPAALQVPGWAPHILSSRAWWCMLAAACNTKFTDVRASNACLALTGRGAHMPWPSSAAGDACCGCEHALQRAIPNNVCSCGIRCRSCERAVSCISLRAVSVFTAALLRWQLSCAQPLTRDPFLHMLHLLAQMLTGMRLAKHHKDTHPAPSGGPCNEACSTECRFRSVHCNARKNAAGARVRFDTPGTWTPIYTTSACDNTRCRLPQRRPYAFARSVIHRRRKFDHLQAHRHGSAGATGWRPQDGVLQLAHAQTVWPEAVPARPGPGRRTGK